MAYHSLVRPLRARRALDAMLLGGVSALALMVGTQPGAARGLLNVGSVAPTVAAQQAAAAAATQAAAAAAQAQNSLARAAQSLAAAQRLQAAAAAAGAASSVPNGLLTGGLVPTDTTKASLWTGANAPVETINGSQVTVDIQQTQQKALLYWNSFNVGANTTVNFQQSASNWIAFNRVNNSTAPSQVFGKINALGAVYIINSNGIIFGAGSQINVNTLVASSLDIGPLGDTLAQRDSYYLNTGIANLNSFSFYDWGTQGSATSNAVAGNITVQRGAQINANIATDLVPQGSPGDIYLFGANVYNSGLLNAPTGEIAMVAARTINLVPNGYSVLPTSVLGTDSSGDPLTLRGTEFTLTPFSDNYDSTTGLATGGAYLAGTGAVVHDGLIEASRGIVIMNGDTVSINNPTDAAGNSLTDATTGSLVQGVISVDTSIDRNSFVILRAATSVTMDGVITALPYDDGSAPLPIGGSSGSTVQNFTPPYIEMTAQSTVTIGSTGLISAPSAAVSLRTLDFSTDLSILYQLTTAPATYNNQLFGLAGANTNTPSVAESVVLSPGSVIDVAGLENVTLPASYNFISFEPRSEFANMPVQRNGVLYGETLWVDIRTGTPLADASGYIDAVGRSIYQLMTAGGSVNLQTDLNVNNGGARVVTAGSVINVAGGNENFQAGWVPNTVLLGADGRMYNMADANPNMVYVGIANQFTVDHSRWGITQTWSTETYSPAYSQGEPAGSVNVTTVNPYLLGTIYFGSVAGQYQIDSGQLPSQGSLSLTTPSSVQIGPTASDDYSIGNDPVTNLSADTLSSYGLSSLSITSYDLVVSKGSTVNLAPGGSFSVAAAGAIDIAGTVSAAGGKISLTTARYELTQPSAIFTSLPFDLPTDSSGQIIAANIYVEGTLDVSGRFVNDSGLSNADLTGPADINGGSIAIATNSVSNAGNQDWTGSILLAQGSLLDVSSGGYISAQGKPTTTSSGVMTGQGGSISLSTYRGNVFNGYNADSLTNLTAPTSGHAAVIELDGSLLGYGFTSNGSLTLSGAGNIQIGGTLPTGATSGIVIGGAPAVLPVSLFTGGGFGSYTIDSVSVMRTDPTNDSSAPVASNITVAAGVDLSLQQQNLAGPTAVDYSQVATGTKLGQQAPPALATLPSDQRQAVNLALNADNILLDKGSTIATDPGANIVLGDVTYDPTNKTGSLPATSVALLGSIVDHSGSVFINATATQLGPQALVDLSGTFVPSSTFGNLQGGSLTSGTYLAGGTFTVEAGTYTQYPEGSATAGTAIDVYAYSAVSGSSYLVADSGSVVDVSGAAGVVNIAGFRGTASSTWSWSDAGTVSADAAGFAWGGTFLAAGGRYVGADGNTYADPRASNGTFILGGGSINLSQDTSSIAPILSGFQQGTPPNAIYVAASQLAPFDNVYLFATTTIGGAGRIFTDLNSDIFGVAPPAFVGSLNITGSVNLDVADRLHIAAGDISAASPINAQFAAPYIELTGGGTTGTGTNGSTLTISGQTVDVEGASFLGFSQVNLISSGDLRLSTIKVADGYIPQGSTTPADDASSFTGSLTSSGNLLFSAQRIYPLTAVTFTIETPGNVQFTAPSGSNTSIPLAAAGGIDVIAANIDQAGNLFAPLGQITLGNTNSATSPIITQSVTLEPGSLTSVTLADTVVPYGATQDGADWYYNASLNPLSELPSKGVVLAGSNVSVTQGSTIDLRGGGDLQAMEWVSGKGGTVDTLETTANGPTVYALVPTANAPVAAYDIQFATSRSLNNGATVINGDTNPLVGTQITIAGGGGIAAGTYTLYPAHYATLPGAMKVTVYENSNLGRNIASGTTLNDGTVLVTGTITQSTAPGKQSSGQTVFAVQTNAVWQSYSEYQFSSANSYFANYAAKHNVIVPLPMDAGALQAIALQAINLSGAFLAQPGQDSSGNIGHGSELDISSPQMIDVVGHAQYVDGDVPAGYVAVDVSELDNSGFESILIGGVRSISGSATLITPSSAGILVDTRGQALTAPEILLVATPEFTAQSGVLVPVTGTGEVTIAAGSVIDTTGAVNEPTGRNYYFGAVPGTTKTPGTVPAQSLAAALGGTLDSTGTVITGATGNLASATSALQSYLQSTTGSMFVATNDSTLNASGPTATPLTVQFASGGSTVVTADAGKVTLWPGASITTNTLSLQATGSTNAIVFNTGDLHVDQLNLAAPTIALGSTSPLSDVSLPLYDFQFTGVGALTVKALSGTIDIYGDYTPGQSVTSLTLDAGALEQASAGGDATISAGGSITLINSGAASTLTSPAAGSATLSFDAPTIVLGSGNLTSAQTILGYGNVNLQAANKVFIAGPGSLTLGAATDAVNLNVATPAILVGSASGSNDGSFAITTGGNISIVNSITQAGLTTRPVDSSQVGGNLALTGASIDVGTVIQAQAGTISLEATTGDVTLNQRAYLDTAGYATTLVDVVAYQAGGKVVLKSDNGDVNTDALSVIDVAQPAGGQGYGGEVDVTALNGNATLNGFLLGSGGPGHGGTFNLDIHGKTGQSFDLTSLADQLLAGGFTGSIGVETGTGNLVLAANHTLMANSITLTADDQTWVGNDVSQQFGQIYIAGTIDASGYSGTTSDGFGEAGGQVALYAANSITLASTGVINASTTHADQRGGDVTVAIAWSANGKIFLQQGTQINVSGGTEGGLSGGTVTFVAPLDGNNDMKIAVLSDVRDSTTGTFDERPTLGGINITGARSVVFDGYVAFDTTSSNSGINGSSLGWNGFIDPNGWYTSYVSPTDFTLATNGTWTNVTGYEVLPSGVQTNAGFQSPPAALTIAGANGTNVSVQPIMGVFSFNAPNSGLTAAQVGMTVTFPPPPNGGTPATGVITQFFGQYHVNITNPGSGYTSPPSTMYVNGVPYQVQGSSLLAVVSVVFANVGNGISTLPTGSLQFSGGLTGGQASVALTLASGFSGTTLNGQFTALTGNFIPLSSSITFNPATQGQSGVGVFTGSTASQTFITTTLEQFTQGNGLPSTIAGNYGFTNLFNRLQPLVSELGASVVQVQPGVQLVNSTGDVTVLNNWNLASGTAGNLQTATNPATNTSFQYFDPASSYVSFNYRLVTPWGNVDPGSLTMRASGNINIDASISDGFFQTGNYLDPNYLLWVKSYLNADTNRSFSNNGNTYYLNDYSDVAVPVAPYNPFANTANPTSQDLAGADLFPNSLIVCTSACGTSAPTLTTVTAPSSWSYTFTAGANLASANPTARISLASATAGNTGDVIVGGHTTYSQTVFVPHPLAGIQNFLPEAVTVDLPTMVRTGTGDVTVAAARDVVMQDTTAPGVIYAAGVNTPLLPGPNYSGGSNVVAGNPNGFLEPQVVAYADTSSITFPYYGPPTQAAFPEMGGDVLIDAQRDVIGYNGSGNKVPQYYQPWLLADSDVTPAQSLAAGSVVPLFGAGVFAPTGSLIASQTSWWIQYGSFQQGFLSAGGNVTVLAGRDLVDVSVSLPTTGRVSGGLSADSTPVTSLYGSGNMIVRAGRNILGGSFYEGSGEATIFAGGMIGQNGTVSRFSSSSIELPDLPLLAVDTGTIEMVSLGSLSINGVVNPAALQAQQASFANPLETSTPLAQPLYMDTYGPDSAVRLVAETGNLTIAIAPTAIQFTTGSGGSLAAPAMYPASLDALALGGDLITTGIQSITAQGATIPMPGIVLSPSDHGTFDLLAQGSVDLTFGFPSGITIPLSTPRPYISAGSSLIDTGFDPFQPDSGFDGPSSGALLAHADDAQAGIDATARIYAVTGSITATGNYGENFSQAELYQTTGYQIIQINRPAEIYAGKDITDLNVIIQNIHTSDVSSITAGGNITYTGFNNGGGLQVAGPGYLVVQAGGDIGPFVPSNADNAAQTQTQEGIASVGNASATPVGDIFVKGVSVGIYDETLFGSFTDPRRNTQLTTAAGTSQGASLVVLFGIKSAPDYQAMIDNYFDPASGSYLGYPLGINGVPTDPQAAWQIFQTLSPAEQQVWIYQAFFDVIKDVAEQSPTKTNCPTVCAPAWQVISTLFPTGHTLGSGELNLLHGTIQTRLGGSISILGPGGDINVGSLATEPNPNLKLRDLGILTLGGGDINTYTDGNVLVNSSRVLTTQGGDVLMWTSFGDLDAGRGSKTIVSAPALQVNFDQNDYETIDPGGYVTGSGIGTLQASSDTPPGNLYLVAPNGTIDFGTAGVRASGNAVFFAPVITNASNFQVSGTATGVPSIPSLSGSVAQSANTTQNKPVEDPTASGGNRDQASVFIVEVIGYGGGDNSSTPSTDDDQNQKKKP